MARFNTSERRMAYLDNKGSNPVSLTESCTLIPKAISSVYWGKGNKMHPHAATRLQASCPGRTRMASSCEGNAHVRNAIKNLNRMFRARYTKQEPSDWCWTSFAPISNRLSQICKHWARRHFQCPTCFLIAPPFGHTNMQTWPILLEHSIKLPVLPPKG